MRLERRLGFVVGAGLIVGGYLLGSGPYEDRQRFDHAGFCAASAAGQDGCVTRAHAVVVSRSGETHDDPDPPDPNWPPQPQPPPPPVQPPIYVVRPVVKAAHVLASQTTSYTVVLRTDDGRRHAFDVGYRLYDVAKTGTQASVDRWHGRIKRITIGTRSDDQWSTWRFTLAWVIAWAGVMVTLAWTLPIGGHVGGFGVGAWWAGLVVYLMVSGWGPAWYVVPIVIGGAVLLIRAKFAIAGRRRSPMSRGRW